MLPANCSHLADDGMGSPPGWPSSLSRRSASWPTCLVNKRERDHLGALESRFARAQREATPADPADFAEAQADLRRAHAVRAAEEVRRTRLAEEQYRIGYDGSIWPHHDGLIWPH